MRETAAKDGWDKIDVVARLLLPVVVIVIGAVVQSSLKSSDVEVAYVGIAVGILSSPAADENVALRQWAVTTLKAHSPVEIDQEAERQLLQQGLPMNVLTDERGIPLTDENGDMILLE